MQRKTIRLGRSSNNDKVYPQGDVSGTHAKVTYLGNNEYEVEDLESANGTYVNGYRIKKAKISDRDQLRLSAGVIVDVSALFGKKSIKNERIKSNPKDFVDEFAELEMMYNRYKKDRKMLSTGFNKKMSLIRGAITLSPIIIIFLANLPPEVRVNLMGVMVLGSTAAGYFTSGFSIQDKMEELDVNFRIRYVCPNERCQMQLNGQPWTILHHTGFCPKCGAIYNKEKL